MARTDVSPAEATTARRAPGALAAAGVLLALLVAGGETIRGFAAALCIGVVVGTYSSLYVASNVLVLMKVSREDLLVPAREGEPDRP